MGSIIYQRQPEERISRLKTKRLFKPFFSKEIFKPFFQKGFLKGVFKRNGHQQCLRQGLGSDVIIGVKKQVFFK